MYLVAVYMLFASMSFAEFSEQQNLVLNHMEKWEYREALELLQSGVPTNNDINNHAALNIKTCSSETVKLLNLLGVPPFGLGSTYPSSALIECFKEENISLKDISFLDMFHEIQQRVILAQALGFKGNSTLKGMDFELEGSKPRVQREAFFDSLCKIEMPGHPKVGFLLSKIMNSTIPSHKWRKFWPTKEFSTNAGNSGHAFSVSFNPEKKLLLVGNRGARPENIPSGILVFSTEKTQPHDLEKLFEFINDGYGTDYYAKLYEMLDQFFGVPIYVLDMPEQSAGNCSWVALELILTSRIFMDKFNTVTNEKAGTVSQGVSLFLLREVYKDRVRTYVRSNSSLKSKEILESCYHFSAGANLVDYSWEGESRQPGQATYPWFSSILDQALLEESCAELANLGYSCPYRRNNNFILAVQTTIVGGLGLTLYGSVKLIKTLRAILNK